MSAADRHALFRTWQHVDDWAARQNQKRERALRNVSLHSWGSRRRRSYWEHVMTRLEKRILTRFNAAHRTRCK